MDFDDSPEEAAFRAEARAFLARHAPRERGAYLAGATSLPELIARHRAWQATLAAHGWGAITWPVEHGGRGLGPLAKVVWQQELAALGLGESILTGGLDMLGPTLIAHGSPAQRAAHLPATLRGERLWCQLFSEPGAGSDLASLATRGTLEGDTWVVEGQKLWSSFANHADWGFLLVRSDPRAPKHAGITYLLVDMRSPGIEVRPLREMTGGNHFNEVFLGGVRIPDANRVGPRDGGWAIARTTLAFERMSIGNASAGFDFPSLARFVRERTGGRPDALVADELARLYTWSRALELLNARVLTRLARGEDPSAEASLMKNAIADILVGAADLALRVQGADAMAREGPWQHAFLFAPSMHIGGGTREVQKSLVAERVLGLPREPDPWKDVPFAELPRS